MFSKYNMLDQKSMLNVDALFANLEVVYNKVLAVCIHKVFE